MRKQEFLAELRKGLSGLPQEEAEERLTFYSEMIDDRMEEGLTEEAAVAEIGTAEDVVAQILSETPRSKLVTEVIEKVSPKRTLSVWEILLLVLGSPIWLSLLITVFAVVITLYVSLWAVDFALAGCFLGGILSAVAFVIQGNAWTGIAMLGAGLVCGGITILFFFVCKQAARGALLLTEKIFAGIKSRFVGKERLK